MKIAIMQPYFAPYIGYFQMLSAVDKFVFYDDVNFIVRGWINRNRILNNGDAFLFSIPLEKPSLNNSINNTRINQFEYDIFKKKFQRTLSLNYKKAPYFSDVNDLLSEVFNKKFESISGLAIESVLAISNYIGLKPDFIIASEKYKNQKLRGVHRLLDICKEEEAREYINAIGGRELYKKHEFEEFFIKLKFIKSGLIEYKQFDYKFVPNLSIIDVLMFNSREDVQRMLRNYELI